MQIYPTVGLNVHFMMTNEDEHILNLFWPFRHIPSLVLVFGWVFGPFLLTNKNSLYIQGMIPLSDMCIVNVISY